MTRAPKTGSVWLPEGSDPESIFSCADPTMLELAGDDPITLMLLTGKAATVHEAEEKFLNEHVELVSRRVLELMESDLSEEEFSRHPLILLLRGHGSRRWEDSLR